MKLVTAYKALDNQVYEKKTDAAAASIMHLGKTLNSDNRGQSIGYDAVAFLIDNRKKILPILQDIDAPDFAPDNH